MPADTSKSTNAKLFADLAKFAASAGLPFPPSERPAALPPEPTAAVPHAQPSTGNPAVDRCLAAYSEDCRKRIASGETKSSAEFNARTAYKRAMPPLVGAQNIADLIACVTRGIVEGLIYGSEITQYLYAAQVANSIKNTTIIAAPQKPRGRPGNLQCPSQSASLSDDSPVNTPPQS